MLSAVRTCCMRWLSMCCLAMRLLSVWQHLMRRQHIHRILQTIFRQLWTFARLAFQMLAAVSPRTLSTLMICIQRLIVAVPTTGICFGMLLSHPLACCARRKDCSAEQNVSQREVWAIPANTQLSFPLQRATLNGMVPSAEGLLGAFTRKACPTSVGIPEFGRRL